MVDNQTFLRLGRYDPKLYRTFLRKLRDLQAEFVFSSFWRAPATETFIDFARTRRFAIVWAPKCQSDAKRCFMCFMVLSVCTDCATNAFRRQAVRLITFLLDHVYRMYSTAFRRGGYFWPRLLFLKLDLSPLATIRNYTRARILLHNCTRGLQLYSNHKIQMALLGFPKDSLRL